MISEKIRNLLKGKSSEEETKDDFDARWDAEFPDRGAQLFTVDDFFAEMKKIEEFK